MGQSTISFKCQPARAQSWTLDGNFSLSFYATSFLYKCVKRVREESEARKGPLPSEEDGGETLYDK